MTESLEKTLGADGQKSVLAMLFAVFMKFGAAPVVLGWALWVNMKKDDQIIAQFKDQISMTQSVTEALNKNTNVVERLTREIERK